MQARLASDMRPFPAQIQFASDSAKGAVARLTGQEAPAMVDTEASFAELRDRCQRTVDYMQSMPAAAFQGAEEREVRPQRAQMRHLGRPADALQVSGRRAVNEKRIDQCLRNLCFR